MRLNAVRRARMYSGSGNCFMCNAGGSVMPLGPNLARTRSHPPDVATCVALASTADAVVDAEALVSEFASRLAHAGLEAPLGTERPFRWRVGGMESFARQTFVRANREPPAVDDRESSHGVGTPFDAAVKARIPRELRSA